MGVTIRFEAQFKDKAAYQRLVDWFLLSLREKVGEPSRTKCHAIWGARVGACSDLSQREAAVALSGQTGEAVDDRWPNHGDGGFAAAGRFLRAGDYMHIR